MSADRTALLDAFRLRFGREPKLVAEAPGRVNLIGEHTDYNEGHVLPLAINRTVAVAAAPGGDELRAYSLEYEREDSFPPAEIVSLPEGGWRNYVRGVAWALREAGHRLRGLDLAIAGDVPIGAGLSSSAALEVAVAAVLAAGSGVRVEPLELAALARRAENGFVGVECGVMDQMAALFGRRGHALLIDCRSLEVEPVPLGGDSAIVVVDSTVQRDLSQSPYNERRRECAQAAAVLGVPALRDVIASDLESRREQLDSTLYRRARHVVTEEARVIAAVDALKRDYPKELGRLMYESHESLRDDFEVSCQELDLLVELARQTEGVLGARLTGAGFGGCTVNLMRRDALAAFERGIVEAYRERTGLAAEMYVVQASDGVRVSDA